MTSRIEQPTCLVTGARGYLGSRVKTGLQSRGWKVVELTREPRADVPAVRFQLGEDVSAQLLGGADALVHCAYDFKQLSWSRIQAINVAGSAKLFRAAREAKVRTLVEISSISAFEGCRSLYGKAKLETEKIAQDLGVISIRPALIWGDEPAGMFGRLVAQVESARVLPLFGGGRQIQYLTHEQDLCELIYSCVATKISPGPGPITFADEQPWTFRGILEEIARAKAKKISFVPLPWRALWAVLRIAEACSVPLNFRSDSLVSLMYQNPNPSFASQRGLGVPCRPFRFTAR